MDDDLDEYLQLLPDKLVEPIANAIREQAQMLSDAQRAALQSLEQDPADSGKLEASCRVEPGSNDLEVFVVAGGDQTTTEVRAGSGEDFDYGLAFEFGTKHQHAKPFFYPTYREKEEAMQEAISKAIEDALK